MGGILRGIQVYYTQFFRCLWIFNALPTKLWEGNVFSHVCLFTGGPPCDHYPLCHWSVTGHMGPPETCLNLFTRGPDTSPTLFLDLFKLVHCVAQTSASKWAVGIRLKWILVIIGCEAICLDLQLCCWSQAPELLVTLVLCMGVFLFYLVGKDLPSKDW